MYASPSPCCHASALLITCFALHQGTQQLRSPQGRRVAPHALDMVHSLQAGFSRTVGSVLETMEPDNPAPALPLRLSLSSAARIFRHTRAAGRRPEQHPYQERTMHCGPTRPGLLEPSSAPGFLYSICVRLAHQPFSSTAYTSVVHRRTHCCTNHQINYHVESRRA